MLMPCEVAVKSVVPAIKATLAKELIEMHGLRQQEVASLLGVTQAAVSQYARSVRGGALRIEKDNEVRMLTMEIVTLLANDRLPPMELAIKFCELCRTVRSKRLMCRLHRRLEPSLDIQKCTVCLSGSRCP